MKRFRLSRNKLEIKSLIIIALIILIIEIIVTIALNMGPVFPAYIKLLIQVLLISILASLLIYRFLTAFLNHNFEERNRAIINQMMEGLVVQDGNGNVIDFNPAAMKILGLKAEQMPNNSVRPAGWRIISADGKKELVTHEIPGWMAIATKQRQTNITIGVAADHTPVRWLKINAIPQFRENSQEVSHVFCTFSDITDEVNKNLMIEEQRERLIESSKMALLGEMAGNIAHEINNPLAAIRARTVLLKRTLEQESYSAESILKYLDIMISTSDRIARIVKGLSSFSRKSDKDPLIPTSLKGIIDETLDLCREKLSHQNIEFKINNFSDLTLQARSNQISQVLLNLINNSIDAIEDLEPKWIELNIRPINSNTLEISVTDSGTGIATIEAEKIMQPFYTTKEAGKGTGLGLSISKRIVEDHGGSLFLDSESKNTCFKLHLPI